MVVLLSGLMLISSVAAADLDNETAVDIIGGHDESDVCPASDEDLMTYGINDTELGDVAVPNNASIEDVAGCDVISEDAQMLCEAEAAGGERIASSQDNSTHYGYWVWSSNMFDMNFTDMADRGVTDVLLMYYAFERFNKTTIEGWIEDANENGIRTHIWVQIFYEGTWVRPISPDGVVNYEFFDNKTREILEYVDTKGVYGIHYDYIRFSGTEKYHNAAYQNPGGTEAITYFVNESIKAIHDMNPDMVVSAALMPEYKDLERIYGDDYSEFTKLFDVVMPMVYTPNFHNDTQWVKDTTRWFVENSNGAEVWTGLMTYTYADYDEDVKFNIPTSQMSLDIAAALEEDPDGVILFRFGPCNDIDFNNLYVDESEFNSFSYLNYIILNEKKPVQLENDFAFDEKYDGDFTNGILILRDNITVDGANHIVDAKGAARILNVSGDNITLKNFIFVNACGDRGGAVHVSGKGAKFINCTFINDSAASKGGAVYTLGSGTEIINCTFINNTAGIEAGAVFAYAPSCQIINATVINSSAVYTGAVLMNSANASVIGSYFENNHAEISAGAIGWAAKDNGTIMDCIFVNNAAYNEGGGAIFWNQGKNGLIVNSTFRDNYANFNGSAIFWSNGEGCIIDCSFIANNASVSGGAIYGAGKLAVINSTLERNSAKTGGAIFADRRGEMESELTVANTLFEGNTAGESASAIAARDACVNVANSVIFANECPDGFAVYGYAGSQNSTMPSIILNDNWWGTNDNPWGFIGGNDNCNVTLERWAILTGENDTPIVEGNVIKIAVRLNTYTDGETNGTLVAPISIPRVVDIDTTYDSTAGIMTNGEFTTDYTVPSNLRSITISVDGETIELFKCKAGLIAPNRVIYVNDAVGGYVYQIILKDEYGNHMANENVTFTFNGVTRTAITDSDGWAELNFTANAEGSYNIEVSYAGSYEYKAVSQNGTIKLVKEKVKFLAPNRVIYASDLAKGYTYRVILKTKDGRALENRKVLVILNGKKYLAITDENGVATFNLATNNAGEYRLTIRFAGDRYCNAFEDYRTLKAIKEPVYLLAKTASFKDGDTNKQVSATVISKTGTSVANARVTLEVNGVTYAATTNANGVALIKMDLNQKGIFYAKWAFGGTALYDARSATSKIAVS